MVQLAHKSFVQEGSDNNTPDFYIFPLRVSGNKNTQFKVMNKQLENSVFVLACNRHPKLDVDR